MLSQLSERNRRSYKRKLENGDSAGAQKILNSIQTEEGDCEEEDEMSDNDSSNDGDEVDSVTIASHDR